MANATDPKSNAQSRPEDENPFAPTQADFAEAALEGDAANVPGVRKAAIIENQRVQGGHPDGSAPALDRLAEDLAREDRADDA